MDAKSGSTCERSEVERRMSEEPAWPAPCLTSSVPLVAGPFVRGFSASLSPPSTAGQNTQQRHSQLHRKRTLHNTHSVHLSTKPHKTETRMATSNWGTQKTGLHTGQAKTEGGAYKAKRGRRARQTKTKCTHSWWESLHYLKTPGTRSNWALKPLMAYRETAQLGATPNRYYTWTLCEVTQVKKAYNCPSPPPHTQTLTPFPS